MNRPKNVIIVDKKIIPIPKRKLLHRKKTFGISMYPFKSLKVKESFLVTNKDITKNKHATTNVLNVVREQKIKGIVNKDWKFITRRLPEGIRVWRIK